MSDRAAQTTLINAPLAKAYAVALDFERYPEWAKDVKEAIVRGRDDQGRATLVEFRASALGRSTRYTLSYDYSDAPKRLSWHLVDGDIMRSIDGAYSFVEIDGGTQGQIQRRLLLARRMSRLRLRQRLAGHREFGRRVLVGIGLGGALHGLHGGFQLGRQRHLRECRRRRQGQCHYCGRHHMRGSSEV